MYQLAVDILDLVHSDVEQYWGNW